MKRWRWKNRNVSQKNKAPLLLRKIYRCYISLPLMNNVEVFIADKPDVLCLFSSVCTGTIVSSIKWLLYILKRLKTIHTPVSKNNKYLTFRT